MITQDLQSESTKFGSDFTAKLFSVFHNLTKTKLLTWLILFAMTLPIVTLISQGAIGEGESFQHIKQTVLADYVINTLLLMSLVGALSALLGIPLAWLIANCEFKGKSFFNWALVLPLAMPAYIIAYVYTDLLDYAGPIQVTLRSWFDWHTPHDYYFFDIRSLGGAAVMLALVLYPYVYLLVRANFLEQKSAMTHAARMLGHSPRSAFAKISIPLARTAIVAGCSLVMMETMADFATVNYFAVSTLTTAVYDTWLGHYDLASAAKLSSLMVLGVFAFVYLEKLQHGRKQTSSDAKVSQNTLSYKLSAKQSYLAFGFCFLVLFFAFILPLVILLDYAYSYFEQSWSQQVFEYSFNSIVIGSITAMVALVIAILTNHLFRMRNRPVEKFTLKMASTGYAIPGTVLAIGVLIPLSFVDTQLNDLAQYLGMKTPGLVLSGTIVAIIFAHVLRFTAIANKAVEASYLQISPALDNVAKTLGQTEYKLLRRVHLPLVKRSALVAALLIFVESMKELPAALLLRPFDFQTLPTYVYQFASDEQLEIAALGAILIVIVGFIPLVILNRSADKN